MFRNCLNLLRKKLYSVSFRYFECLFGCFHQVSSVETVRFRPLQLVKTSQKYFSKSSENNFKQFLRYRIIILIFICLITHAAYGQDSEELFNTYYTKLKEFRSNHDYDNGINASKQYLKEIEKTEGGQKKLYSLILSAASYLYDESGKHEDAIQCAERAANIQKRELGDTSQFYLESLTRLANFYSHCDKYKEAIEKVEKARDLLRRNNLTKSRDYSLLTGNLAVYYNKLDSIDKAIELNTEALNIIEITQGKDCKDYADRLGILSHVLFRNGQTDNAIKSLKEALTILESETGREHVGYMTFLNNLSQMQSNIGEYIEALINMGEAKNICENIFGENSPNYAVYLSNFAAVQLRLGKYKEALQSLHQAFEIQNKIYGDAHSDVAITLGSMSGCYLELGEYVEARRLMLQSMDIFEKTLGRESLRYAVCLKQLSNIYFHLGNYHEATKHLDEALHITSKLLGTDKPEYARICVTKASIESQANNNSEALKLDDMALTILKQTFGEKNNEFATVLSNKSMHLVADNQIEEAIRLIEEVLVLQESLLGRIHPNYALTLQKAGGIYAANNNLETAIEYTQKALALFENSLGRKSNSYIQDMISLCSLQLTHNKHAQAASNAIKVNDLIVDKIKDLFIDLSSHERSLVWERYRNWFSFVMPRIAYQNSNRKPAVQKTYDAVLFSKSLLLNSEIELYNLILEEGNEEDLKIYKSLSDNRRQLTKVYELPLEKQRSRTDSLEKFIYEQELLLLDKSKAYGDYTKKLSIKWNDVKNALGDDDIAIEFVAFNNDNKDIENCALTYYAMLLKQEYDCPVVVPLPMVVDDKISTNALYTAGKNICDSIWVSLKDYLVDVKNIYFAPAGCIYTSPIEYISYWEDKDKTISDVFNVYRLSSTREIALNRHENNINNASLFGALKYNYSYSDNRDINAPVTLRDNFGPLVETKTEIDSIAISLNKMGINYDIFTDSIGTEQAFRNLSRKKINLLHIATHGFYWTQKDVRKYQFKGFLNPNRFANFSSEDRALARSGLLLSGAEIGFRNINENFTPDDGILTGREISQLDFRNMNLAVLSACQTGLGDITSDGVFGLQRGFKKAGVQSIMMSLWKVDDKATSILMSKFYQYLSEGYNKIVSLNKARNFLRNYEIKVDERNEIIDENTNMTASQRRKSQRLYNGQEIVTTSKTKIKPFKDPRYWAAFVLLDALN